MGIGPLPRVPSDRKPMQVRIFQEADIADLEAAINTWLAVSPRREIVEVHQNIHTGAGGAREIVVSIWYVDD